jgi:superfamily I DNA/RNA helicase
MDTAMPPDKPKGFWSKMERLKERAGELRYDLAKWDKDEPPPGVYLGTVHSVKGAQWPYVTVQMPEGRFPMPTRHDTEVDELTPEMKAQEDTELEGFRRLAYVAMTRPSKDLRVVAPETYNGKKAGMSRFLTEAGLTYGENVKPVDVEGVPKTSAFFFEDTGAF